MKYEIKEITGHPLYSDRKGRVWGCFEDGKLFATASSRTQAKRYMANRETPTPQA
jgi:hypothetical protein